MNKELMGPITPSTLAKASRPMTAIESQLSEMDATLEGAHQQFTTLLTKLEPVLRASPPSDQKGGAMSSPIASPLAEKLRAQTIATVALVTRINDVLDRLDL